LHELSLPLLLCFPCSDLQTLFVSIAQFRGLLMLSPPLTPALPRAHLFSRHPFRNGTVFLLRLSAPQITKFPLYGSFFSLSDLDLDRHRPRSFFRVYRNTIFSLSSLYGRPSKYVSLAHAVLESAFYAFRFFPLEVSDVTSSDGQQVMISSHYPSFSSPSRVLEGFPSSPLNYSSLRPISLLSFNILLL